MSDKNSCRDHATFDLGTFKRNRAAELVDEPCACAIFQDQLGAHDTDRSGEML